MTSPFDEKAEWFDAHYASTRGRTRLILVLERLDDALPPPPARILDAGAARVPSRSLWPSVATTSRRPGLAGDYEEAIRVLDDPVAAGNLGIPNRSRSMQAWRSMLERTGWHLESWAGVRLFSDAAPDDLTLERFAQLLDLERAAGRREPYRSVSRLVHLLVRAREV